MVGKDQLNEYLAKQEKETGVISKIQNNAWVIWEVRKIYNSLCPACQRMVFIDPRRPLTDYCPKCQIIMQEKGQEILDKIK